jgi:hypothetical protein
MLSGLCQIGNQFVHRQSIVDCQAASKHGCQDNFISAPKRPGKIGLEDTPTRRRGSGFEHGPDSTLRVREP